jgi:excisionase family DNA binding protein
MQTDVILSPIRLNELETLILNQVRKALAEVTPPKTDTVKNELLTVKQAADLLSVSVPTIYGYVHFRSIPCMKRRGRVYFSKPELLAWIKSGKRSTMDEINTNALKTLER